MWKEERSNQKWNSQHDATTTMIHCVLIMFLAWFTVLEKFKGGEFTVLVVKNVILEVEVKNLIAHSVTRALGQVFV